LQYQEKNPVRHHLADVVSRLMNAKEKSNAIFTMHIIQKLHRDNEIDDQQRELLHAEVHQRNDDVIHTIHLAHAETIRDLAQELVEEHDMFDQLDGGRKSSRSRTNSKLKMKSSGSLGEIVRCSDKLGASARGPPKIRFAKSAPHLAFGEAGEVINLEKLGVPAATRKQTERRVKFGEIHIRSHNCTFGEACPSSNGPSVGLGWEVTSETSQSWTAWEEERVDQGRMTAYEFMEEGQIPIQSRVEWLQRVGHRKVSIDFDTSQMRQLRLHRRSSARSKCAVKVIAGEDPDEVEKWEHETLVAVGYRSQLHAWLKSARAKIKKRNIENGTHRPTTSGGPGNSAGQGQRMNNPLSGQRMNPLMQRNTKNSLVVQKKQPADKPPANSLLARATSGGAATNPLLNKTKRRGSTRASRAMSAKPK
jgi:hypothetical protein